MRLTKQQILQYPDGTWIETDSEMTEVLNTWAWNAPRPAGVVYLWRREQLLNQLAYAEYLEDRQS